MKDKERIFKGFFLSCNTKSVSFNSFSDIFSEIISKKIFSKKSKLQLNNKKFKIKLQRE